jgi:hypothetical protein
LHSHPYHPIFNPKTTYKKKKKKKKKKALCFGVSFQSQL